MDRSSSQLAPGVEQPLVDPSIRLQNIMIETGELQAQRQMSWAEATNRSAMFMTIVGATVFGLALVGNATSFNRDFLLVAMLVLPVLLFVGVSSLARLGELNRQDWRLVQGLNRLRQLRVQLDPTIEQHLVTSPYDDVESVLASYGDNNPALHSFWTLDALIGVLIAVLAAFSAAIFVLLVGAGGGAATIVGLIGFVVVMVVLVIVGYRSFETSMRIMQSHFPAPSQDHAKDDADHGESGPPRP